MARYEKHLGIWRRTEELVRTDLWRPVLEGFVKVGGVWKRYFPITVSPTTLWPTTMWPTTFPPTTVPPIVPLYPSVLEVLTSLGYTSNLSVCLDAGAISSYNGSGNWLNMVTHSLTEVAYSSTIAFNGTPGLCSKDEYFSFNGSAAFSNWFRFSQFIRPSFAYTIAAMIYLPSGLAAATYDIYANAGYTGPGIKFGISSSRYPYLRMYPLASTTSYTRTASSGPSTGRWVFFALVAVEGSTCILTWHDMLGNTGQHYSATVPYTETLSAANNASLNSTIGASNTNFFASGMRIGAFMIWESAFTTTQLNNIRTQLRNRWN